jgi:predicted porin
MKKSLGAFAGAASAQSSVTLYGKVDLGVGKPAGTTDKQVMDGSGSRVGLRGVEDLGGGMKALFGFEHRFSPDTGIQGGDRMWNGYSTVGLGGAFGTVNLGRQYTAAFSLAQNAFDPFGGDSVGGLRNNSLTGSIATLRTGARRGNLVAPNGVTTALTTSAAGLGAGGGNSIRYDGTFGGLKVAADIEEQELGSIARPYTVAAQYAAGPLLVAASYENPGNVNDKLITAGVSYVFGPAKLAVAIGDGTTTTSLKVKQALIGATVKVGAAGSFLAGYAQEKVGSAAAVKKSSIGYRHDLSKRTQLYTDFSRVNTTASGTEKNAYDFGVIHAF